MIKITIEPNLVNKTIYIIERNRIKDLKVESIEIDEEGIRLVVDGNADCEYYNYSPKKCYLSFEEAKKKLLCKLSKLEKPGNNQ